MNPALSALSTALIKFPDIISKIDTLLILRAQYFPELSELMQNVRESICVQSFRPYYENLKSKGIDCTDQIPERGNFDLIILIPTQQRNENLYLMAIAFSLLKDDGMLISTMQNSLGAGRFEQHQNDLFNNIESYSKHKCRVFWSRKSKANTALLNEWLKLGEVIKVEDTALISYPGTYGSQKIDKGSELLLNEIDQSLAGCGADLGCGYGYLSYEILSRFSDIKELSLYDSEALALKAAKLNLSQFEERVRLTFHWVDCTKNLDEGGYDFIVMNPPFHLGKISDPQIGVRFIESASAALKVGGALFMVSNAKLPYEEALKDRFSSFKRIIESDGFKVLKAIK